MCRMPEDPGDVDSGHDTLLVTGQRCNALQSMFGIFLHAAKASDAVVELLSRIGLSISRAATDDAVSSDNFDVEVKHLVPTVEKPQDALLHLTSGTLIRLEHGVTTQDLCCSEELWKRSKHPSRAAPLWSQPQAALQSLGLPQASGKY